MKKALPSSFAKYRHLMLAIALFIVLDLGVLVFNFYASSQLQEDAGRINQAGTLRVYSQQLTKALLTLVQEMREGLPVQTSMAQISEARPEFNKALASLQLQLLTNNRGPLILDEAIEQQQVLIKQINETWQPIDRELTELLLSRTPSLELAEATTSKAVGRNIKLMQQATELTELLEVSAAQRAGQMRSIQMIAIALAMLNFVFIVFKFVGSLAASDRKTETAQEETRRILGAVREGLFLLTADRCIGEQRSASLARILGVMPEAGTDFSQWLRSLTSPENCSAAADYIDLMFNPKMKQGLLEQLNPLRELALNTTSRQRKGPSHLSLEFDQVREGNEVLALLVSIFDVSGKVRLEQELAGASQRIDDEASRLMEILDSDPHEIGPFVLRARETLQQINNELQDFRGGPQDVTRLLDRIARAVHAIKGEAGTLGCRSISLTAHSFESILAPLRRRSDLQGDDLIPIAVGLSEMLAELARVLSITERLTLRQTAVAPVLPLQAQLRRIEHYALEIAESLNKRVKVETHGPLLGEIPAALHPVLNEALPQLVRNAVAHGIELPEERLRLGKPETGLIRVSLQHEGENALSIVVEDDGRGLKPEKLRAALVDRGILDAGTASEMSNQQVVSLLFEPGISTLPKAGEHAGRGDGLAVVRNALRRLNGRLSVQSQADRHTSFTLRLQYP